MLGSLLFENLVYTDSRRLRSAGGTDGRAFLKASWMCLAMIVGVAAVSYTCMAQSKLQSSCQVTVMTYSTGATYKLTMALAMSHQIL